MDSELNLLVSSAVSKKLDLDNESETASSVQGECGSVTCECPPDCNDCGEQCEDVCEDVCACDGKIVDDDEEDDVEEDDDYEETDDENEGFEDDEDDDIDDDLDDDDEEEDDIEEDEEDRQFIATKVEYESDEDANEVDPSLIISDDTGKRYPSRKRKAPERYVHPDEDKVMEKFRKKAKITDEEYHQAMTDPLTDDEDEEEEISSYSIEGDYDEEDEVEDDEYEEDEDDVEV